MAHERRARDGCRPRTGRPPARRCRLGPRSHLAALQGRTHPAVRCCPCPGLCAACWWGVSAWPGPGHWGHARPICALKVPGLGDHAPLRIDGLHTPVLRVRVTSGVIADSPPPEPEAGGGEAGGRLRSPRDPPVTASATEPPCSLPSAPSPSASRVRAAMSSRPAPSLVSKEDVGWIQGRGLEGDVLGAQASPARGSLRQELGARLRADDASRPGTHPVWRHRKRRWV